MSNANWKADGRTALGYRTPIESDLLSKYGPITNTELGYKLGYARIPNSGMAHPIAVPAPARGVDSIPRPAPRTA